MVSDKHIHASKQCIGPATISPEHAALLLKLE